MNLDEIERTKNIQHYKQKIRKQIAYKSRRALKNKNTNEITKLSLDVQYEARKEYIMANYNIIALCEKYSTFDYSIFFLTITLDSQFHKYRKFKDKYIENKKYNKDNTANLGYKILSKTNKNIYNNFKVDRKFVPVKYVKIIENHKDNYTPHLHGLYIVPAEYQQKFNKYIKEQITKNNSLGKQHKIEILKDPTRGASYILKYMQKNYDTKLYQNYKGWRMLHNITRACTYTNIKDTMNREVFNKLSFHFLKGFTKHEDTFEEFATQNYFKLLTAFTTIKSTTINKQTGEILQNIKEAKEDDLFYVEILKERYYIDNIKAYEIKILSNSTCRNIIIKNLKQFKLFDNFTYQILDNLGKNISKINDNMFSLELLKFIELLKNKIRFDYKIIEFRIWKKKIQILHMI